MALLLPQPRTALVARAEGLEVCGSLLPCTEYQQSHVRATKKIYRG